MPRTKDSLTVIDGRTVLPRPPAETLTIDFAIGMHGDGSIRWTATRCNLEAVVANLVAQRAGGASSAGGPPPVLQQAYAMLQRAFDKATSRTQHLELVLREQSAELRRVKDTIAGEDFLRMRIEELEKAIQADGIFVDGSVVEENDALKSRIAELDAELQSKASRLGELALIVGERRPHRSYVTELEDRVAELETALAYNRDVDADLGIDVSALEDRDRRLADQAQKIRRLEAELMIQANGTPALAGD